MAISSTYTGHALRAHRPPPPCTYVTLSLSLICKAKTLWLLEQPTVMLCAWETSYGSLQGMTSKGLSSGTGEFKFLESD